jgi:hypothetical protein
MKNTRKNTITKPVNQSSFKPAEETKVSEKLV